MGETHAATRLECVGSAHGSLLPPCFHALTCLGEKKKKKKVNGDKAEKQSGLFSKVEALLFFFFFFLLLLF